MSHKVLGEVVTASAFNLPEPGENQKWYQILPVGEQSAVMASGHQFTVPSADVVTLPADPVTAHVNQEHDRKKVVGNFAKFAKTTKAIFGLVDFAPTTEGKDALVLASRGLRKGISVELEDVAIKSGLLLKGTITNAAVTVNPSFGSAAVLASAADVGEVTDEVEAAVQTILDALAKLKDDADPETPETPETPTAEKETPVTVTASTPDMAAVLASLGIKTDGTSTGPAAPKVDPLTVLATAQAQVSASGLHGPVVTAAALDQITQGDVFDKVNAPAYAGELWKGRRYQGRYLELASEAPMTAQSVVGWRWIEGKTPQVAVWSPPSSGSPATMNDIPTNEVKAEQVTHSGFRIAGGHAVDRIHVDMPSAEWWASYNLESTDDYARKLDAAMIAHITNTKYTSALELAAGLSTEERILEGIGAAVEFSDPDYILLGWDLFKELALGRKFDQSTAMASGGEATITLASGKMSSSYLTIPVKAAPRSQTAQNGRIIVGSKYANELQSLPGGPVRVDGQNIQKGLVEHGVFGYHILRDIDRRGVVEVTKAAAPAPALV